MAQVIENQQVKVIYTRVRALGVNVLKFGNQQSVVVSKMLGDGKFGPEDPYKKLLGYEFKYHGQSYSAKTIKELKKVLINLISNK